MSDKNQLDAELERAAAELEKKREEIPARQAIRNRLASWNQEDQLHKERLERVRSDCKHPAMRQTGGVRRERDQWDSMADVADFTCEDCGKIDRDRYV